MLTSKQLNATVLLTSKVFVDISKGVRSMTQLLLFETPTQTNTTQIAPIVIPSTPAPSQTSTDSHTASERRDQYKRGVNHMGDLARLVLMRYDMVAERRAKLAARRAQG